MRAMTRGAYCGGGLVARIESDFRVQSCRACENSRAAYGYAKILPAPLVVARRYRDHSLLAITSF